MTTKHKIASLSGRALDWAVMHLTGWQLIRVGYLGEEDETPEQLRTPHWFDVATDNSIGAYWMHPERKLVLDAFWPEYTCEYQKPASPSTDWALGGPLIEGHGLAVGRCAAQCWSAMLDHRYITSGTAPLEAVCRTLVYSLCMEPSIENVPPEVL